MHVRRALLLFAMVLGVAALATAVSQPRQETREPAVREEPAPTARPGPGGAGAAQIEFAAGERPRTRRLTVGRSATVVVQVPEAGEVTLEGLGVVADAEPLTPARFEVLGRRPARHRVRFIPAGDPEATTLGLLAIVPR
jgi:hypothetical protein